jgi:hypothetical protein
MTGEDRTVCYDSEEVMESFNDWLRSENREPEPPELIVMREAFTAGMNEILVRIEDWTEWLKSSA